ncbi:probable cardiolipin synthase (CMP-forming) [Hydractinia symbiolongicarpus]|uniref:probable cardiolipin synthase (CMP-forming) n=1 Tax=Hydractinia symbiolongicarpus TaxID=13093 RepID=UPI00254FCCB3|nr:probable cardiolipin synthase (CMP-forming) [Hydractinia symbiolongicarpus]
MFLVYRRISKLNCVGCSCRSIFKETLYKSKQHKRSVVNGFTFPVTYLEKIKFCNVNTNGKLRWSNKRHYFSLKYYTKRSFFTSAACNDVNQKSSNSSPIKKANDAKYLTIPNALTMFRLLVSPYIGYLVLCEQFNWAFGLVFLAGLTDAVDGWIARNFKNQSSNIGSYIDPLADKVLISILTLSLTAVHIIPMPLCGLIIARDLLLVGTSSHFHYKHLDPPKTLKKFFDFENSKVKMEPTGISKFNTFLQLGLVGLSVAAPVFHFTDHSLLHAYWYLVASTTVLSGLSYVVKDKSAYIIK